MRDRKEAPFIQSIERHTYDKELTNFKSEIQSDEVIRETRTGTLPTNAEVIKRPQLTDETLTVSLINRK